MKISTKGRYALRVMIDLAEQNSDEYIPLKAIAKKQEISEKYLESIIVVLSKAGFNGRNARQRAAVINWRAPCGRLYGGQRSAPD